MAKKSSVDQLNSFLRGELSAVETYRMALDKLDASPSRAEVEACLASHHERVIALRDAIIQLGGKPADSSGPWGLFAKAVEGTAKVFGDKAAIAALEEGEDHGLRDYKGELDDEDLDMQSKALLTSRLLPAQQATHDRMSALKHRMKD
ncbi:MAG TPA: DUF2383 domain-containing protein [Kofleriaceae bacterium]